MQIDLAPYKTFEPTSRVAPAVIVIVSLAAIVCKCVGSSAPVAGLSLGGLVGDHHL